MTQLKIPFVAERFLGVTIPEAGVMYACSYGGLHKISFGESVQVETDEGGKEDYDLLKSKGDALGIFGGTPILEIAQTKIAYVFDNHAESQKIEVHRGGRSEMLCFETLSGGWFFASLSKCGIFILLAEPYAIGVYRIT